MARGKALAEKLADVVLAGLEWGAEHVDDFPERQHGPDAFLEFAGGRLQLALDEETVHALIEFTVRVEGLLLGEPGEHLLVRGADLQIFGRVQDQDALPGGLFEIHLALELGGIDSVKDGDLVSEGLVLLDEVARGNGAAADFTGLGPGPARPLLPGWAQPTRRHRRARGYTLRVRRLRLYDLHGP